jgi:nucleoside-diphosphate-sugar epimerase
MRGSAIAGWASGAQTGGHRQPIEEPTMNDPSRRVLVLGANGRLGRAAVEAFAAAGWRVFAHARRAPAAPLPPGAQPVDRPLDDLAGLAAQAAGARVVVHALNPPYTRWAQEALSLARQGMDLAQRLGATFMLPGNVYNFGSSMPALLQPDTPQRADSRKGRIRVQLEAEMRHRAGSGLRSVVLRAGDFYGGGRGSWFDQVIVGRLARGRLVYPGPLDVPHAWAYLPDLARAFVAVAARDDLPAFGALHFAGHTLTGAQLLAGVERAAASLGRVPAAGWRRGGLPWPLLRAGGWLVPMWRELAEIAYLWRVPHALDDGALQACAGPLPATPLDAALRRTLLALGHGGRQPAADPTVQPR